MVVDGDDKLASSHHNIVTYLYLYIIIGLLLFSLVLFSIAVGLLAFLLRYVFEGVVIAPCTYL